MVSTTPYAYENLFSGKVDMIFAAAPSESQKNTAEQKGLELTITPIGRVAFVFFVHQQNPVDSLTVDQITDIYTGKVTTWEQLGARMIEFVLSNGQKTVGHNLRFNHL